MPVFLQESSHSSSSARLVRTGKCPPEGQVRGFKSVIAERACRCLFNCDIPAQSGATRFGSTGPLPPPLPCRSIMAMPRVLVGSQCPSSPSLTIDTEPFSRCGWSWQARRSLSLRDHDRTGEEVALFADDREGECVTCIQAEIAMFLAEHVPEGQPATSRPTAWELITPEKGKLFVVGDPKQSIYRFRRADVAQMKRLQQRMEEAGGRTVSLVQNFRSQKRLIAWVNRLFEQWMGEDGNEGGGAGYFQAGYEAMSPRWEGDIGHPFQPRVWALADTEVEDRIDAIRRQEAEDIAGLLRQIVNQQWQTLDREATEATGREAYRPVKYSDICILMPSRTGLQILERGIEGQDIPYRLARIHRRTVLGTALEEARGCSSESGIMVL